MTKEEQIKEDIISLESDYKEATQVSTKIYTNLKLKKMELEEICEHKDIKDMEYFGMHKCTNCNKDFFEKPMKVN